jgi:hypothetical protein
MVRVQRKDAGAARWRLFFGLLCVALLIFAGTLSVAHGHNDGTIDHADCTLCVAAHATVQLVAALPVAPATVVFTRVENALPAARPRTLSRFALFTRPPPARAHLTS